MIPGMIPILGNRKPISSAPPLDGLSNITGAYSMDRLLLTAYGGSFFSLTSGNVSTWLDQSGNSRHLFAASSGARPDDVAAGPQNRMSAVFDGTDDELQSTSTAMSSFIGAGAGYVIFAAILSTIEVAVTNS